MSSHVKVDSNEMLYYSATDNIEAFKVAVNNIFKLADEFSKIYNAQISL